MSSVAVVSLAAAGLVVLPSVAGPVSVPGIGEVLGGGVAQAAASPATGEAGVLVPVQGRVFDSRTGSAPALLAANTWTTIDPRAGGFIPANTPYSAVVVTLTAVGAGANGALLVAPNTNQASGLTTSALQYAVNETTSNTAMIAPGSDGKIAVRATTAVDVIVELQGYYSAGDTVAAGGFVPVTNVRYLDTRQSGQIIPGKLQPETTYKVRVGGNAGVPATATAVFANVTAISDGVDRSLTSLAFWPGNGGTFSGGVTTSPGNDTTATGRVLDIDANGDLNIRSVGNSGPIDLILDIQGYFDGTAGSQNAFTPTEVRVLDTQTATIAGFTTTDVQISGVGGLPAPSAAVAAYAVNVTVDNRPNGAGGAMAFYPADAARPDTSNLNFNSTQPMVDNLAIVKPSVDGKIRILYNGDKNIRVLIDVQGYYANVGLRGNPFGTQGVLAGDRSAAKMVGRQVTDTIKASFNPTSGNMLLTGGLLNLPGVNDNALDLSWRYNSINDTRPTLNTGAQETALRVQPSGAVEYRDGTAGVYVFTPAAGGGYTMPPGINTTLRKVSATGFELQDNTGNTTNVYDGSGAQFRLVRTLDSTRTNVIAYTYSGDNISRITDTQGRVVTFAYNDPRNLVQPSTIADTSLNRTISLEYAGPGGAMTRLTDMAGQVTTFGYDGAKLLNQVTDAKGQVTTIAYSSATTGSKVASFTYAAGSNVAAAYTAAYPTAGQTKLTDPRGNTSTYDFTTGAYGTKRVTQTTDANGNTAKSTFDGHDNLTDRTNGAGEKSTTTFDAAKNVVTKSSDPGATGGGTAEGASQRYSYNTAPTGNPFTDYRPSSGTDDQGNVTTFTYDPPTANIATVGTAGGVRGTITRAYQGDRNGTTCYAKAGQLCTETDGKNQKTSYTYDGNGNLTKVTPPAPLGATSMTYDAAGRMTTMTDGKGQVARYAYDKRDRRLQVSFGAAGTCAAATCTAYTVDAVGNLTQQDDASGRYTYTLDAQNRVVRKNLGQETTSMAYDPAGNIARYTDSAGQVTYAYDKANRQTSLAEPSISCPATKPTTGTPAGCTWFAYDSANRRTVTTFPNGFTSTTTYDSAGKTKTITGTPAGATTAVVSRNYTYNPGPDGGDGKIRSSVADESGTISTYGYDAFRQLTTTTRGTGPYAVTENFGYDRNGNRTSAAKTNTATKYSTYNAADQLCNTSTTATATCAATPAGGTGYTYDANGNPTTSGASTQAYSVFNQVASTTTGTTTTQYTYAGTSNTERTTAGGDTFLNGGLGITKQTRNGQGISYYRDAKGTPQVMRYNGVSNYYITDALGSVIYLSAGNNGNSTKYTYDAWGNTTSATGDLATTNPYRYATGYTDTTTGLTKMGARYYNPTQGRFTQIDPSGQDQHYLYGDNNPISNNDPSGESWKDWGAVAGGLAGTFVAGAICGATAFIGCVVGGAIVGAGLTNAGGFLGAAAGGEDVSGTNVLQWTVGGAGAALLGPAGSRLTSGR